MKGFEQELSQFMDIYSKAPLVEDNYIKRAKKATIGKNKKEVVDLLYEKRAKLGGQAISQKLLEQAFDSGVQWEHTAAAPPTSAWTFTHGLTRVSQLAVNADKRNMLDTIGGKILDYFVPDSSLPVTTNVPASL